MRIKCPNTGIALELPGERTDMKFTCPACHMLHRVTVAVTTLGDSSSPPSPLPADATHLDVSAAATDTSIVEISVDEDFIILDAEAMEDGVDLEYADPSPGEEFFARKTEIITPAPEVQSRRSYRPPPSSVRREQRSGDVTAVSPRPVRPDQSALLDAISAPMENEEEVEQVVPERVEYFDDARPPAARRGKTDGSPWRGMAAAIALIVLALGGYLGYQQYKYGKALRAVEIELEAADSAWSRGAAAESARAARDADLALRETGGYLTPARAWRMIAGGGSPDTGGYERRIRQHYERERRLNKFESGLDAGCASLLAARLADAAALADGDPPLLEAMEKSVVAAAVIRLRDNAAASTPEEARAAAYADRLALLPALSPTGQNALENQISSFVDGQRRRMVEEIKGEVADIAAAAKAGEPAAMKNYLALMERIRGVDVPELRVPVAELGGEENRETLVQLSRLSDLIGRARSAARSVLSQEDEDDSIVDDLAKQARGLDIPNPAMAVAAAELIGDAHAIFDNLLSLRVEVYTRLQSEMRRNRDYPGTRLAWSMLRIAFDDPEIEIDPAGFKFDSASSEMKFFINGTPASMAMNGDDYEQRVRATVDGYTFTSGWAIMFRKPVMWMASMASAMRRAGIDADRYPEWELVEGPGGPLAFTPASAIPEASARRAFFDGRLYPLTELPQPEGIHAMVEHFRTAAQALEEEVMGDESVSLSLRQALRPVLMGTYQRPDPRDYFDSSFCRRLIEADYLESFIAPMPPGIQERLDAYRDALDKLEAGLDEFSVDLGEGGVLYAVVRPDAEIFGAGAASDQDPETGESVPPYMWRIEKEDKTIFFSPQPARFIYAFSLAEHYAGVHKERPEGVPSLTEVWHATRGLVASYRDGDQQAEGDEELWNMAIAEDSAGRFDPSSGPPGWNYPLHVLQRDHEGDPVRLATLSGTVESPDFSGIDDPDERLRAEDEWLDHTAETLSTPGELGLIFHQFFRYCSDSPLPELPNLIGSHYGLSDTHQTVYESLERRWVGRLIGDCDDLAEFFQVLTRRQGKLSHVMQLPGHAAAGYVEKISDDEGYRFVVLQTGPVMQFTAGTLRDVVELAYRSFDRGDGISHMTTDAVPLLLRFANEETRTPFVLSARIYEDAEYADTMIQVQSFWHEHVFSSAIEVMEKLVEEDKEIGNIKELGSLYERVGFYDKSEQMRREELRLVLDNPQATMSTLLEIVQLHTQDKNRPKALEALGEMERIMQRMVDQDDANEFFRNMTFRSYWAMYLSRLGQPDRAWRLIRYDASMTKRQLGRVSDPVLRTMVFMYDRMCLRRDSGEEMGAGFTAAMREVAKELEEAFSRGYFKSDDSYNAIIGRYFTLGRYAVADLGREEGLALLDRDGPYAAEAKDHTKRSGRGVDDEDWSWFRITPQLYYAMGMEMLDQDEAPELYDPAAARPMLENVARAVEKGTGLGADVSGGDDVVKADLTLSFLNDDLAAFRRAMTVVKEKDYSSLYDDAAMTFGLNCGLIPLNEFPAWTEAFREFFPGSQHYFKVVYRAIDKEHYEHARIMAEATAGFFPDNELLRREADFVKSIVPGLIERKNARETAAPMDNQPEWDQDEEDDAFESAA